MSCERRANRVGGMAAGRTGISQLTSQSAGLTGSVSSAIDNGMDRLGQAAAPVTARLVGLVGPDQSQRLMRSSLMVAGALGRTKMGRQWGRQALRTGIRLGGKGTKYKQKNYAALEPMIERRRFGI